jgi:AraC-like DNA-binding protein
MSKISAVKPISYQHRRVFGTVAADHLGAIGGVKAQSNELRLMSSLPRPPTAGPHVIANIGRCVKDSVEPGSEALETYRADPCAQVVRTLETNDARVDLLRFEKHCSPELELPTSCHSIVFLINGVSGGCEWSDGHQTRMSRSLAPNTLIFSPAQDHLRIRVAALKSPRDILILNIQPTLMKWRTDLEIDLADVQFQQKVGLYDETACQSLIALKQELVAPGIYGAIYTEMLLFLLLTRLVRCASNFAEPSKAIYAKGGLPNWRLKRAIELLEVDLAKMPTLVEVSKVIGLHPTSFCRGFKQSIGVSPHQYMLVHRVNRAKEMMGNRALSLTEIALDCGFGSSSQFSIVFKRITGMPPRDFRRAL